MNERVVEHARIPEPTPSEATQSEELAILRLENKYLRERIQLLLQERFGAKSEQLDRAQLLLMFQGPDALGTRAAEAA